MKKYVCYYCYIQSCYKANKANILVIRCFNKSYIYVYLVLLSHTYFAFFFRRFRLRHTRNIAMATKIRIKIAAATMTHSIICHVSAILIFSPIFLKCRRKKNNKKRLANLTNLNSLSVSFWPVLPCI